MRALIPLALGACAAHPTPVPTPAPAPEPVATGSIAGKPFRAWSAVMTDVNTAAYMCTHVAGEDGCSTRNDHVGITHSTVTIFERDVTCADVHRGEIERRPRERTVDFMIQGLWPPPPHTTLPTEVDDGRADHIDMARFTHVVLAGSTAGELESNAANGHITIVTAAPDYATLQLDLASEDGERLAGTMPLLVCF